MGGVIQKKKNKSSAKKVKQKSRKSKDGSKKIDVLGNAVIAQNWDKNLTLLQNYRRLGLASRLNIPAGGTEKVSSTSDENGEGSDLANPLTAGLAGQGGKKIAPAETRVERDPKTGKILRVVEEGDEDDQMVEIAGRKHRRSNPLEDPLENGPSAEDSTTNGAVPTGVVSELELQAAKQGEALKKRKPRQQSKREVEWLERLVDRYGDDTRAMARDKKLNPMQQTEADISRRLKKWKR